MATFTDRLRQFFGFQVSKTSSSSGIEKIEVKPIKKKISAEGKPTQARLSSDAQKLWDWYTKQTSDSSDTLRNRLERYKDLEYMLYNDSIFSLCIDLYADETAQADDQFNLIGITSKDPEVQKEIKRLFDLWNINQAYIRDVAFNLALYGDSFDILDYTEKEGIISVTPIDVHDVTERLEFKYSEVLKKFKAKKSFDSGRKDSVINYLKQIEKEGSKGYSSSYTSYLLGFVLNESDYVFPWQVNHYRLESRKSEFWPYGRPMFINLVGPFRQLKTAKNLMALTRAMKFPKEIYEVQTSEEMDAAEKWDAVNEARTEFANLGRLNKAQDEFSVGDEVWVPQGLVEHKTISNDLRIEDIADISLLRDDFIMGTSVPKGYLIVDQGGWGNSAQSLLQQSKAFARKIYTIQSATLSNLSHLVRMHFLMTGQFEKEFTEFQLSLNYPVVEEASDRMRMKQDSLRFANEILDAIKNAIGSQENPPAEIVKKIFSTYSFLDPDEVEELVDKLASKESPTSTDGQFENSTTLQEKYSERLTEIVLSDAYFEALKKENIKEWVRNRRHYYVSSEETITKNQQEVYEFFRFQDKSSTRIKE